MKARVAGFHFYQQTEMHKSSQRSLPTPLNAIGVELRLYTSNCAKMRTAASSILAAQTWFFGPPKQDLRSCMMAALLIVPRFWGPKWTAFLETGLEAFLVKGRIGNLKWPKILRISPPDCVCICFPWFNVSLFASSDSIVDVILLRRYIHESPT